MGDGWEGEKSNVEGGTVIIVLFAFAAVKTMPILQ